LKKQKDSLVYLKDRIVAIFNQSNQIYGSKRIQKPLEREGLCYSASYISVLMRKLKVKSVLSKKFKLITTDSSHNYL
jgi:hypothetical protein